jgi:hypothetical protein
LRTAVAFIVFNRPDTTERVFSRIAQAKPPKLLIIADGARADREGERAICEATRAIAERVDWECEVLTNYSDTNLGCKFRISSGLDWVFQQVEEAIILEDDCVPETGFFRFCDDMLERYRHDDRVTMISGSNFLPVKIEQPDSYFYSRFPSIWGWATWRRAWKGYDVSLAKWRKDTGLPELAKTLPRRSGSLSERIMSRGILRFMARSFDLVQTGKLNTWDYQWIYQCIFGGGFTIVPSTNQIQNIGVAGVHTTGRNSLHYLATGELPDELVHPRVLRTNDDYDWALYGMVSGGSPIVSLIRNGLLETPGLKWLLKPARKVYLATRNQWNKS